MSSKPSHEVLAGGLSTDDHEHIFAFAARGWKAHRIAAQLLKHPATVQWFMYRNGLQAPQYRNQKPYLRNGRLVVPFDKAEDDFITSERVKGVGTTAIAAACQERFGRVRSVHTVYDRLVMLAARDDEAEAA